MAIELIAQSDSTSSNTPIKGSDNRLNSSSRTADRSWYISRDTGLAFPVVWIANGAETGEYVMIITNTSNLDMIVENIGVNSVVAARFQLEFVDVGAVTGTAIVVVNGNESKPKTFSNFGTAFEAKDLAGGIANITLEGLIDQVWTTVNGHQEFRLRGIIRVAQGHSIAIKVLEATGSEDVAGVAFVTFE